MRRPRVSGPARRRFLRQAGAGLAALATSHGWAARLLAQTATCTADSVGALVRTLPLYGAGADEVPLGRLIGSGLDARQYTDLSRVEPGALTTPGGDLFIRTTAPDGLPAPATWTIGLRGVDGAAVATIALAALAAEATDQGTHVIECAGNANPWNFGLMSAATFRGVTLERVLARAARPAAATAVLVTGHDHAVATTTRSLPGASWILPHASLATTGAFLATHLDGQPLTPDHGAPVRLVVPGWYGCAWIKWVHDLQWLDDDARSTTQMLEFAFRTHQDGIPMQSRDYQVPAIDVAAMPVRVEERRVSGATEYRIVGLMWGGQRAAAGTAQPTRPPVERLLIRFGSRDAGVPVTLCDAAPGDPWRLWTYRWRPESPGPYDITLKVAEPAMPTRRLDLSYYIRRVHI